MGRRCADDLLQQGRWTHDGSSERHLDASWSWAAAPAYNGCKLLSNRAARKALRRRWVVVVGDSVARFLYAALLALANRTDPAPGWPTHRVSEGTCMAHVVANGTQLHFGYYHPGCTLRWKGVCSDGAEAQVSSGACALDYRIAGQQATRLTFVWQSTLRGYMRVHLRRRLTALVAGAGGRTPDLLIASIGHWDYMYPSDETCPNGEQCCPGLQAGLRDLAASTNASLKLWHGHFWCPSCAPLAPPLSSSGYGCGHFGEKAWPQRLRRTAAACGRDLANAEGYEYLDVQHLTASVPQGIVASPCGQGHHFGVLADAQALVFVSLMQQFMPAEEHEQPHGSYGARAMHDDAERTFGPWVLQGLGRSDRLLSCASDALCALPHAVEEELSEQAEVLRRSQHLEAGQRAGLCAPTSGKSGRHDCASGSSGFWSARANNLTSMVGCIAKCSACGNCRYVSFSRARAHDECAWYKRCDLGALVPPPSTGLDYATVQVRGRLGSTPRRLSSMPAAERSLGTGHCGATDVTNECKCTMLSGSWSARQHGIESLDACAARCARCPCCNYVAFSETSNDCSWYQACDRPGQLVFKGHTYTTRQVRIVASSQPPPPPAFAALEGSTPGFCALMGSGLGDCARDDQGSFMPLVSAPADCIARCSTCPRCAVVSFSVDNGTQAGGVQRKHGTSHNPPHLWACRWFAKCDMGDLLPSLPHANSYFSLRLKSAPGKREAALVAARHTKPQRPMLHLAIAGLVFGDGTVSTPPWTRPVSICLIAQWCENAARFARLLPSGVKATRHLLLQEGRLLASTSGLSKPYYERQLRSALAVRNGSGALRDVCGCNVSVVDSELEDATSKCQDGPRRKVANRQGGWWQLSLKWNVLGWTQYDAVLFVDMDAELLPLGVYDHAQAVARWVALLHNFVQSPRARVVALPDHSTPVNTGLMLLRPDRALYDDGVRVMRGCHYNSSHGWHGGSLEVAAPRILARLRGLHTQRPRWHPAVWQNVQRWAFYAAGTDQGFFYHMLYRCHHVVFEPWQDKPGWAVGFSRHWFGPFKPHQSGGLAAAYELDPGKNAQQTVQSALKDADPSSMAWLYDFVLRAQPLAFSKVRARATDRRSSFELHRACAAGQARVRRAIEAHPQWDVVARTWHEYNWHYPKSSAGYLPNLIAGNALM